MIQAVLNPSQPEHSYLLLNFTDSRFAHTDDSCDVGSPHMNRGLHTITDESKPHMILPDLQRDRTTPRADSMQWEGAYNPTSCFKRRRRPLGSGGGVCPSEPDGDDADASAVGPKLTPGAGGACSSSGSPAVPHAT